MAGNGTSGNIWGFEKLKDLPIQLLDGGLDGDRSSKYPKRSEFQTVGIPFLNTKCLNGARLEFSEANYVSTEKFDSITKGRLQECDIILNTRGNGIGKVGMFRNTPYSTGLINAQLLILRVDPTRIDAGYLLAVLVSELFQSDVRDYSSGSAQPQLPIRHLREIRIPLPPLPEQKAIAHILGTLDDKIELNRRMNETLEGMARAIFKSWFVDFDPVRAKMDGRPVPGMDAATAELFPDGFEHVDGELVPRGWRVCPLPEAVDVNPRRSLEKGSFAPYLDMKNMPTAGHRAEQVIAREFKSGTKFINGDTLLARITPCLENGKTAFVDFLTPEQVAWGSTEYIVLRPKSPLPVEFGYYLARSEELRLHAIQNMTGTSGRQRVPANCFDQFLLPVPPESVAARFGEVVEPMMLQIRDNSEQARTHCRPPRHTIAEVAFG